MRVLITGANGLLGRAFINVHNSDDELISIVKKKSKKQAENIQEIEIDLGTNWDINLLPENIDAIIHLAQSPNFRQFPDKADDIFNVNIYTVSNLLQYAHLNGVGKVILASSGGIYQEANQALEEDSALCTNQKNE